MSTTSLTRILTNFVGNGEKSQDSWRCTYKSLRNTLLMDPERLAQLFDRHAPALVLYARQWCDSPEDVVQEAFLRLSKQAELPELIRPWLYRVVRNAAISSERQRRRRRQRETAVSQLKPWFETVDDRLEIQEATTAIQSLSDVHREAVIARLWGEMTFEELAALQNCSRATAHRRYRDALRELQSRLESCTKTTKPN